MPEYIEREALIKRLEVSPLLKPAFSFGENLRSGIIDLVKKQPTADVAEVKYGEWVKQNGLYSCSVCGKTCPYEVSADLVEYWTCHYCPNCGADMRGKQCQNDT